MRCLLVQSPHRDSFGYSMPPPGLLRLGGELERQGIEVELEDLAWCLAAGKLEGDLIEACAQHLAGRGTFSVVGFSVMGATLPAALAIAADLRALSPATRIILGGPGTTGIDRELLTRFPVLDAVVRGEGEVSLVALLRRWEEGADAAGVAGVTWRSAKEVVVREEETAPPIDLSQVAPYARHLLPALVEYKHLSGESEGLTPIDSGRGCVYDCSFCTIGRFWQRRSRPLPAAKLADEVQELRKLEGARQAYLCHDIFGAGRAEALAFCAEMSRRGPWPWECRARVDHLDPELLDAMAQAGCYRVLLGVESGAPAVRELCNKQLRANTDVLAMVRACIERSITPILSLILGLPGEGDAELEASLELCLRASLIGGANISLHLVNPQPGCSLAEEFGTGSRPIAGIAPDMALGAGESPRERELIARHPDLFSTWSLLPGDEGKMRYLAELAALLPPIMMHFPRTWALMLRDRGGGQADMFRAWRSTGGSFEEFVRARGTAVCLEALAWEEAIQRAAAASAPRSEETASHAIPRVLAEHLSFEHDLPTIADCLARGEEFELLPEPTRLCVQPSAKGARTSRVGAHVEELLCSLDGASTLAQLEARNPGISTALEPLVQAGLVSFSSN